MKKSILLLASAVMALTSCQKSDDLVGSTKEVTFKTEIKTRVASNQFENGDQISVVAYEASNIFDEANYTFSGSTSFQSAEPIKYDGSEAKSLSYVATYPAIEGIDGDFEFQANLDQSVKANYSESDLLVATVAETTDLQPTLSFYHKLSNIIINVVVNGGTYNQAGAMKFNAKNNVACNIKNGTYEATGSVAEIIPSSNATNNFNVLLAPQVIAANETVATFEVDGQSFAWSQPTEMVLLSGMQYNYTMNVDLATGTCTVVFNGLINGWGDGNEGETGSTDATIDSVNPTSLSFTAAAASKTFEVTGSNLEGMTATSSNGQFTATVAGTTVTVAAAENTTDAVINGIITVSAGDATATVAVAQAAAGSTGGGSFEDFRIDNVSLTVEGQADYYGNATIGGVDFEFGAISSTDPNYPTIYMDYEAGGFIANTTAFSGLKSVTINGNGYVKTNVIVTAGASVDAMTVVESTSADGSGWGSEYEYAIPADAQFIKFAANVDGGHDAGLTYIDFKFDGTTGGGDASTDPVISGVNPTSLSFGATASSKTFTVSGSNLEALTATSSNAQFTATVSGTTVTVAAAENTTASAINGVITVSAGTATATVAVSQAAAGSTGGGDDTTFENFTINSESLGFAGQSDYSGTATVGGVDFTMAGVSSTDSFGSTYVDYEAAGYIANTSAITGLKSVTIVGNKYVDSNLVVSAGASADALTVVSLTSSDLADGTGWGSEFVYTIPADAQFVKFAANTEGTHDAGLTSITFSFDGTTGGGSTGGDGGSTGGDGGSTGGGSVGGETICTFDTILAAMGQTSLAEGVGLDIENADMGDFVMDYAGGTSNTGFRLWGSDNTIRSYAGNLVTFTAAAGKTLKSIEFSFGGFTEATVGTIDDKLWTGDAEEVTLTLLKGSGATITVVCE